MKSCGWAGALLYNERTSTLIDGHLRREQAITTGVEAVPVLIGSWSKRQEAALLATLDPIAAAAEIDEKAYRTLLESADIEDESLRDLVDQTLEWAGLESVYGDDEQTANDEPDSDDERLMTSDVEWKVLVDVEDETSQASLIKDLMEKGYQCKPLML